jgi:hypothetical protein
MPAIYMVYMRHGSSALLCSLGAADTTEKEPYKSRILLKTKTITLPSGRRGRPKCGVSLVTGKAAVSADGLQFY